MDIVGIGWSVLGGVATAIVLHLFNLPVRHFRRWRTLRDLSELVSRFELESGNLASKAAIASSWIDEDKFVESTWRAHLQSAKKLVEANFPVLKPDQCHYLLTIISNHELAADTLRNSEKMGFSWDEVFQGYLDALAKIPWLPFERSR